MTVILIITALGWIFALIGWWYESRYRKKTVKAIRQELKAEIRWIEINNYQDIKKKEIETYKHAIKIVERYIFDE